MSQKTDLVGQTISLFINDSGEIVLKIGNSACFLDEKMAEELSEKLNELRSQLDRAKQGE